MYTAIQIDQANHRQTLEEDVRLAIAQDTAQQITQERPDVAVIIVATTPEASGPTAEIWHKGKKAVSLTIAPEMLHKMSHTEIVSSITKSKRR